ncbi:helix-turn-helix transcriptional regulator [Paraclostridium sordellii]|uniref:helix-turn-helix transcriptional regulator n=1 Tax=Paraclostridium sordellii TaxID=1505 RepID=UPI0005E30D90|nr:hypothetical protein [Paeniclostridium sordellii]CEP43704.1 Uncharacterised protein [[Clostridium] sordellii] [Paeniclostridium sordellii]CEP50455.1 Uncharacterised protein [[Clostridium] sordellii] [Paeniclostridium sordellii]
MDKLDIQIKLKKFLMTLYEEAIMSGNNLKDGECIRIYQNNKSNQITFDEYSKVVFLNNIDDVVSHCTKKNIYNLNTYFNLATTDGASGQLDSLKNRYFIAFDFDKKDYEDELTIADIINKFNTLGLKYHALIDSGNGYHAYMMINKTSDIKLVEKVTKTIATKLGADTNACKTTQVLRVPYTWNIKDKKKQVRIINIYDKHTIKRYDIEKLAKRFCRDVKSTMDVNIKYAINSNNIKPCVAYILENGSKDGRKNFDLQKIVVDLRNKNKSLAEIKAIAREWNFKSENSFSDSELNYQVEYLYDKLIHVKFECNECDKKESCDSKLESDFNYSDDEILLTVSETAMKSLKKSKRKGVKCMEGNDLVIYGILKNHNDGLFYDELENELTYKKKCRFSKPTVVKALKNLDDNGFIEVETVGKKKLYKLTNVRNKVELTYNISFSATYECIKGNITSEELRLYNYIRYLHHKEQRENPKALKGNLFQMNQRDIATSFGVVQSRISEMINNLIEEKIMSIWYRQTSQNNGFDYYVYRLNY